MVAALDAEPPMGRRQVERRAFAPAARRPAAGADHKPPAVRHTDAFPSRNSPDPRTSSAQAQYQHMRVPDRSSMSMRWTTWVAALLQASFPCIGQPASTHLQGSEPSCFIDTPLLSNLKKRAAQPAIPCLAEGPISFDILNVVIALVDRRRNRPLSQNCALFLRPRLQRSAFSSHRHSSFLNQSGTYYTRSTDRVKGKMMPGN